MDGRMLHLGININGLGHPSAWRRPDTDPLAASGPEFLVDTATWAEKGLFDVFFMADVPALQGSLSSAPQGQSLEPVAALSAVAVRTSRIGLVATLSTTFSHPYSLARSVATLDRLSHGRAGWNVVTSHSPDSARSYGMGSPPAKEERYRRAEEFVDVVERLWRTWGGEDLVLDKETGSFADEAKVRRIDHRGAFFSVAGGSTVPRSEQGSPVIFQAGASEHGLLLAHRHADAVFVAASSREVALDYRRRLAALPPAERRSPLAPLVLPGLVLTLAADDEAARRRRASLDTAEVSDARAAFVAARLGLDPGEVGPDDRVPLDRIDVVGQRDRTSAGFFDSTLALARRGLTLREIAREGAGHLQLTGSPRTVAAQIESWFRSGAVDGFNLMFDIVDEGLPLFVESVVPLLQASGIYRRDYTGSTLRSHLGLTEGGTP